MKPKKSVLSLALAGLLGALSHAAAQTPLGPQFRVDPSDRPVDVHAPGGLVFDPAGTLWMAWENEDFSAFDVEVRSLPRSGTLTPPLSMLSIGDIRPHLVPAPNGLALFASNPEGQLEMQRFNHAGTRRGKRVVIQGIDRATVADPYLVAPLPGGGFFIAWTGEDDGPGNLQNAGVYGRVIDGLGNPRTRPFRIPEPTEGDQNLAGLATDPQGNVLVTWEQNDSADALVNTVVGRFCSPAGHPLSPQFQISRGTRGLQGAAAADAHGTFVVAWESFTPDDRHSVYARRFSARGRPLGPEILVSRQPSPAVNLVRVAMSPVGDFFVAWSPSSCAGCDADEDVHGRLFHADGTAEDEIVVNDVRAGRQTGPSVAFGPGGLLAVSWYGDGAAPHNGYEMDARLFSVRTSPALPGEIGVLP